MLKVYPDVSDNGQKEKIYSDDKQPPKTERPKLIVNKWHLDTADYRASYRRYLDFVWDKFAESEADEAAKLSDEEIKKGRAEQEAGIWDKCNEEIAAMFFEFKPDGAYAYRYRGGAENGTFDFTPSFDTLRLKNENIPNGYKISMPVLSDSVMKLSIRWPLTQHKASDEKWYQIDAKFISIK